MGSEYLSSLLYLASIVMQSWRLQGRGPQEPAHGGAGSLSPCCQGGVLCHCSEDSEDWHPRQPPGAGSGIHDTRLAEGALRPSSHCVDPMQGTFISIAVAARTAGELPRAA